MNFDAWKRSALTFAEEEHAKADGHAAGWLWLAHEAAFDGDPAWKVDYRAEQAACWRRIARRWAWHEKNPNALVDVPRGKR